MPMDRPLVKACSTLIGVKGAGDEVNRDPSGDIAKVLKGLNKEVAPHGE